jgi:ATP-binding cassette subfamily B protein
MQNKTVIVVAHRLSTLQNLDRILVFENGKVIEDGTHADLLKLNGKYSMLWNMQIDGYIVEK